MKKKRNIRQRGRSSDSDEEKIKPVSTKGDQIPFLETDYHTQIKQLEKEKSTKKKEKSEKKKQGASLLTFAYDEDDGEGKSCTTTSWMYLKLKQLIMQL